MIDYHDLTIRVPASIAPQCRAMAQAIAGDAARDLWITGLSATGAEPATHYVSSGAVGDDMLAYLTDPAALSAATGLPLVEAEALIGMVDVVPLAEEDPFESFARWGQQLVGASA